MLFSSVSKDTPDPMEILHLIGQVLFPFLANLAHPPVNFYHFTTFFSPVVFRSYNLPPFTDGFVEAIQVQDWGA